MVLLTLNSQFSPLSKYNALAWAAEQCTSEVYRYRTRTQEYNAVVSSDANLPEEKKWKLPDEKKTSAAKMFMDRLTFVNEQVSQDSGMASDSMSVHAKRITKEMFDKHKDRAKLSADKVPTPQYKNRDMLLASLPGGAVAKEDEMGENGDVVYEWVTDDGFSSLSSRNSRRSRSSFKPLLDDVDEPLETISRSSSGIAAGASTQNHVRR